MPLPWKTPVIALPRKVFCCQNTNITQLGNGVSYRKDRLFANAGAFIQNPVHGFQANTCFKSYVDDGGAHSVEPLFPRSIICWMRYVNQAVAALELI